MSRKLVRPELLRKTLALAAVMALGTAISALPPQETPVVQAACSSLPAGGFVWNVHNVPFTFDSQGDPDTQLSWGSTTAFVGAIVKAKYETTEGNAVWYCAKIVGLNAFAACPSAADPAFPAGTLGMTGVLNDPSTSPCSATYNADGTCLAEVRYTLTFAKFDSPFIGARTLAQTYYWVDDSSTPNAHDWGDCNTGQAYRYVNSGPIYGDPCSGTPSSHCYTVFFEPVP